jgi:hypothetical protein
MCGRYDIVDGNLVLKYFNVKQVDQPVLPNLDARPSLHMPVLLSGHARTFLSQRAVKRVGVRKQFRWTASL